MSLKDIRTISCYVCIFWLQQAPQTPCHTPSRCAPSPKKISLLEIFAQQKNIFLKILVIDLFNKKIFSSPPDVASCAQQGADSAGTAWDTNCTGTPSNPGEVFRGL